MVILVILFLICVLHKPSSVATQFRCGGICY